MEATEVPSLECKVSLLKCYEPAENYLDWEIGTHGLTIEFDDDSRWVRSATYLPDIAKQEVGRGWDGMYRYSLHSPHAPRKRKASKAP